MASTSIIGIVFQGLALDMVTDHVFNLWVLAAPVVLFEAPLGAIFLRKVTPNSLLVFIVCIVTAEIVSTLTLVDISLGKRPVYFFISAFSIFLLYRLYQNSPYHYKTDAIQLRRLLNNTPFILSV